MLFETADGGVDNLRPVDTKVEREEVAVTTFLLPFGEGSWMGYCGVCAQQISNSSPAGRLIPVGSMLTVEPLLSEALRILSFGIRDTPCRSRRRN